MNLSKIALTIFTASMLIALAPSGYSQTQLELQIIRNAETMTYAGRCVEAINSLRALYQKYPGSDRVALALKNAFVCSKDYDSAKAVLQQQIQRVVDPVQKASYQIEMAGIEIKTGDLEGGKKMIQDAVKLAPYDGPLYENAADVFMSNGYYTDAIKFLEESREKANQPSAFARKLAQLYEIIRNYGDAAREYFTMSQADSASEVYVIGRISNLIKLDAQEEFDTGLKKALSELIRSNPRSLSAQRYYGDYLVAQGNYKEALERFRMVDSLENGKGRNLLYFARTAQANGAHDMVEKACSQIVAIPDSPIAVQAKFMMAESQMQQGRYEQSAAIYQGILDAGGNERDISEALFSLGVVTLQGLHKPVEAIALFERLIERYPRLPMSASGKMLMGDCYLAMDKPLLADSLYATVNTAQMPVRDQEQLFFKRAELQFYTGNFAAARDAYSKVMTAFPKSVFVNDCLRRIMLISEYSGMEEATLQIFASALYSRFRFEFQRALDDLSKLKGRTGAILPEIAWLECGEIYEILKQDTLAIAEYDSLVTRHPASFYTPIAIEKKGDIYSEERHECEPARAAYQQVLLNYGGSLNVEEVRRKLVRTEKLVCNQQGKASSEERIP